MNPIEDDEEDAPLSITEEKAGELVAQIIPLEDDGRALALVAIIQALADEDDRLQRELMAGNLIHAAYGASDHCSASKEQFVEQAKAKYLAD
jgi:hypothetical protein